MRGPRMSGNGIANQSNGEDQRSKGRKRKVLGGIVNSNDCKMPKEERQRFARKHNYSEYVAENAGSISKLEMVVVDGRWDAQAFPSLMGEVSGTRSEDSNCSYSFNDIKVKEEDSGSFMFAEQQQQNLNFMTDHPIAFVTDIRVPTDDTNAVVSEAGVQCNNEDPSGFSWLINFKLDSIIQGDSLDKEERENGDSNSMEGSQFLMRAKSRETSRMLQSDSHEHMDKSQSQVSSNRNHCRYSEGGPKKPPYTYTELIEQALRERGELTVSGIYQWISEHFPYYKADDDRWKNSVRHNLSINPHFRKGNKASHGAGHLWTVANFDMLPYPARKMQRLSCEILPKNAAITIDEVEAATASIEENKENRGLPDELFLSALEDNSQDSAFSAAEIFNSDQPISLEQSAEEILSGVKKDVEVQYLIPMQEKSNKADFLNPVSKEKLAQECGLLERDEDMENSFLVTDLNPIALELNMVGSEAIPSDDTLFSDMDFEYFEFTPQQLEV